MTERDRWQENDDRELEFAERQRRRERLSSPGDEPVRRSDYERDDVLEAYLEGFSDGAAQGNLRYKYPPRKIAILLFREQILGEELTVEELDLILDWTEASYSYREDYYNKKYCSEYTFK